MSYRGADAREADAVWWILSVVFLSRIADNPPVARNATAHVSPPPASHGVQLGLRTFGKALHEAYTSAGLSKRALAGAASLDRSAIKRIEEGLRAPDFGKLLLLARAAKATPAALLTGIGPGKVAILPIEHDGEIPPADPLMRFAANLRWVREHCEPRMTQEGLALEAQIDRSSASGYETGRMRPNLRTILKLAAALGVSPSLLMEGVELAG
jgi:transcriptional regulator with XRE-family HTH domain